MQYVLPLGGRSNVMGDPVILYFYVNRYAFARRIVTTVLSIMELIMLNPKKINKACRFILSLVYVGIGVMGASAHATEDAHIISATEFQRIFELKNTAPHTQANQLTPTKQTQLSQPLAKRIKSKNRSRSLQLEVSSPGIEQTNYTETEAITFSAQAFVTKAKKTKPNRDKKTKLKSSHDKEVKNVSDTITWYSSIDGFLGEGATFDAHLTVGVHTITTSVDTKFGQQVWQLNITVDAFNTAPTINLLHPRDGSVIPKDLMTYLAALTNDVEDGLGAGTIVWTSDIDGAVTGIGNLSIGHHQITATVTDSGGLKGSDSVSIEVVPPVGPVVGISSPMDGQRFVEGESVSFQRLIGIVVGNEIVNETLISSIDGVIRTHEDMTESLENLSVGMHTLTITVTDSYGTQNSDTVDIEILDSTTHTRPTLDITSPSDYSEYTLGTQLFIAYWADDAEDGYSISDSLAWSSSIDGSFHSFADLSVGQHLIKATVTDSSGLSVSDSFHLNVNDLMNTDIEISLDYPNDGDVFYEGDFIPYAYGIEPVDGFEIGNITLSSSIDGKLDDLNSLSVGQHTLTLSVPYWGSGFGLIAEDSIDIEILAQPENTPPRVSTGFTDGHTLIQGGPTFIAFGIDDEDGFLIPVLSSNIDGVVQNWSELSLGHHIVTATVTDSGGLIGIAMASIEVVAPEPWELVILSPTDNSTFSAADMPIGIAIGVKASPVQADAILWDSIVIRSDIDGEISQQATLSVGQHTLTATAVTESGNMVNTEILVLVIP